MPTDRRVLLITVRSDFSGGPRHVVDLLKAFEGESASGAIEFFIAAPDQKPYGPKFKSAAKQFLEIPARSFSPMAFIRLLFFIWKNKIAVVHSHGRGAGVYSRLLSLFTGTKVLHSFHGIHRETDLIGRLKLGLDRILAFTDFTAIFVSDYEKAEATDYGCVRKNTPGFVIENPVDETRFQFARPEDAMPGDHTFASGEKLRIGAFLRSDQVKGPDLFLNLARSLSGAHTWSCAGITRSELETHGRVVPTLEIKGRLLEPAEWLQCLDIFISTSRNEAMPLGVLEALAAGRLCVLSDIAAHRVFHTAGAALLFDASKPETLTAALKRLETSPALRDSLRNLASQLIHDVHSVDVFRKKLAPLYLN